MSSCVQGLFPGGLTQLQGRMRCGVRPGKVLEIGRLTCGLDGWVTAHLWWGFGAFGPLVWRGVRPQEGPLSAGETMWPPVQSHIRRLSRGICIRRLRQSLLADAAQCLFLRMMFNNVN